MKNKYNLKRNEPTLLHTDILIAQVLSKGSGREAQFLLAHSSRGGQSMKEGRRGLDAVPTDFPFLF